MALSEHKTHVRRDTLVRVVTPKPLTESPAARYVWAIARFALGWVFVWAFLDKLFGLGHATPAAKAWVEGGSPTEGFLKNSPVGPFAGFYHDIAGAAWADWLFMIGLAGIGAALVLGIGMRIAAAAGAVLLVMMWTAVLPPENNVFMDDHLVYAIVLVGLALVSAGDTLGLGRWWGNTRLAKRFPVLK
ncbi:DoxX family membrane protein [Actinomadura madurae]|uniref:DoxX family membrane protein n=1 Tax=Actinomadura madurae TaxID=1993 RepID=UPI0020D2495A|nr:DoxX family membrane protein [Actinomadura madurae]MCP9948974.1 DoxX family membrane protein [Actinomadura madurae]MCP9965747.1 DoxX family membrane protein [Actinomadura madurae]MCP9978223.1 DoxX family membrane protein [Actinomadura madurae]MCQ0010264.1 DoxX family membrane protein [Actinomadura madurae]MCQ0014425.1 DoxX family membrane protein [Actinomadura madurae]